MTKKRLSNGETAQICRGLSVLLHAGMYQSDSLFLMAEEEGGEKQELLCRLGKMADDGCTLSKAIEEQGCFPGYALGLIKVGEHTGHLEEALNALADYYEGQARLVRQLKNTLTYPLILIFLMMIVIGILLVKVLPVFEEVYESLGASVTGVAKGLLLTGELLESLLPVLWIVMMLILAVILLFAVRESFRERILLWCRRKFRNHEIAKKINAAHFAQALTMGLKSGMVIEEVVGLAGELLKDIPEAVCICRQCEEKIKAGEPLGKALKECNLLPAAECRMLEIGMCGGNGDDVMSGIAERLMEDAECTITEMISKIEPAIVMLTSLLVGMILLSVMMPLINIMSAIG